MERVAISLAAGDATNLELRLLKVVEEVLGKHAKARQPRVKQDERRVRAPFAGMQIAEAQKVSSGDIAVWGTLPPRGNYPTQTPKATGQRGEDCDNYRPLRVSDCFWMEKQRNE